MRKMKDSGIEWIGKIRQDWNIVKIKNVAKIITGNTPSKNNEEYYSDDGIQWIKPDNINDDMTITPSKDRLSELGRKEARIIPKGSVAVCCIGTIGKSGVVNEDCTTNQQINTLVFNKDMFLDRFGKYVIFSSKEEHERNATQVVLAILNKTKQGNIFIPRPPLKDQHRIANFLDHKTTQLDSLLSSKQAQIQLLTEYKQSLISETVTKGLNPNVPMKDSGVEWVGEIPEHWNVSRIKTAIIDASNGIWGDDANGDSNDIECIRVTNFDRVRNVVSLNNLTTRNLEVQKQRKYLLQKNDILIEKSGGGEKQPVGFSCLYPYDRPAIYANFLMRVRANKVVCYPVFLSYYFVSLYKNGINNKYYSQTTGIQNLDPTRYFEEKIVYPTLLEQQQIVEFLDHKTSQLDSLISQIQTEIEKLKEYKQSLIFEAVTGKLEIKE